MKVSETAQAVETHLVESRVLVDAELNKLLPESNDKPRIVHQAIRWSVFAGGKRFRPALLLASGKTFTAPYDMLIKTASAVEMIHTYSLIHDDLPAMDDDHLRRGVATCHIQFDDATAILAGDALQTLAFKTIAQDLTLSSATRVLLIEELADGAGTPRGMVAGQANDIEAESRPVTAAELEAIHRLKTGALITAAARCGAIIAEATHEELEAITHYASHVGLLFQITDDMLDVTSTLEELGKTPGKDARALKATYPSLYGLDETRAKAEQVYRQACEALDHISRPGDLLRGIADYILNRTT
ncbi:MAG: polyprenyl synthetase family protein [Pyrinomonadaceae bacterium]